MPYKVMRCKGCLRLCIIMAKKTFKCRYCNKSHKLMYKDKNFGTMFFKIEFSGYDLVSCQEYIKSKNNTDLNWYSYSIKK